MTTVAGQARWVGRSAVGDPDRRRSELAACYEAHAPSLLRLATALVGPSDARDLVHEAFTRSAPRIDTIDAEAQHAYLRAALVNVARSRFRRAAVSRRMAERGDRAVGPGDATSPEHHAVEASVRADLLGAIDALSARQRLCIVLRYFEDLDEQQIAATTGMSRRSVRTHLERALARLATRFHEEGP